MDGSFKRAEENNELLIYTDKNRRGNQVVLWVNLYSKFDITQATKELIKNSKLAKVLVFDLQRKRILPEILSDSKL